MLGSSLQWLLMAISTAMVAASAIPGLIDPATTLDCHRREYTFRAQKSDSLGRKCWDYVTVMSCWGRCDTHEIADWKFPYKRAFHPVCIHDQMQLQETKLANCDPDVEEGTAIYEYYEAITCSCQVCRSSQASCEGLHARTHRMT